MALLKDDEEADQQYMRLALEQARKSPPKPTNFCVGAVLVEALSATNTRNVLATGYTLEEAGNTHAEQSAFIKLGRQYGIVNDDDDDDDDEIELRLGTHVPSNLTLYTTMEPCNKRSPGNLTCVERILRIRDAAGSPVIKRVCVGVSEPSTFVGINQGRSRLVDAGIQVDVISGFDQEILAVATAGHVKAESAVAP